jgi:hypothetical protein
MTFGVLGVEVGGWRQLGSGDSQCYMPSGISPTF